jgi:hypothetical protein
MARAVPRLAWTQSKWVMWAERMDGQPGGEAEGHPVNGVDYH